VRRTRRASGKREDGYRRKTHGAMDYRTRLRDALKSGVGLVTLYCHGDIVANERPQNVARIDTNS